MKVSSIDFPLYSLADAKEPWNRAILYFTGSVIIGNVGKSWIRPLFLYVSRVLSILTNEKPTSSITKDVEEFNTHTLGMSKVDE